MLLRASQSPRELLEASASFAHLPPGRFAGPHTIDPRTGEILDADIMFAQSWISYWLLNLEDKAEAGESAEPLGGGVGGVSAGDGAELSASLSASGQRRERLAWQLQRTQQLVNGALGEGTPALEAPTPWL